MYIKFPKAPRWYGSIPSKQLTAVDENRPIITTDDTYSIGVWVGRAIGLIALASVSYFIYGAFK